MQLSEERRHHLTSAAQNFQLFPFPLFSSQNVIGIHIRVSEQEQFHNACSGPMRISRVLNDRLEKPPGAHREMLLALHASGRKDERYIPCYHSSYLYSIYSIRCCTQYRTLALHALQENRTTIVDISPRRHRLPCPDITCSLAPAASSSIVADLAWDSLAMRLRRRDAGKRLNSIRRGR